MSVTPDIARIAALIADPTRATILMALTDGRALPPSELALAAGVSRSTVSGHLSRMLDSGLLAVETGGRNRYYRLAGPEIATALESLAVIAPTSRPRTLRESNRSDALRSGRTCYGHLAGRLGVSITDALIERGALARSGDRFTFKTDSAFDRLGLKVQAVKPRNGILAKPCNDWTERRPHLAGPLGVALARRMFELNWVERLPQPRAVRLTDAGRRGLREELGIDAGAIDR